MARRALNAAHYRTLAALRRALRQFLSFSHAAAREAGLPPQQHQALLAIKGWPEGTPITISGLAEHLGLKHHSTVGLVDRLGRRGLVVRRPSTVDRRRVELKLTARGETLIARLSSAHLDELKRIDPELRALLALLGSERGAK